MTRASVIVPSRAGAQRLPRLLRALAAQTHTDLEVIVVLDGVIDDSPFVLDRAPVAVRRVVFSENRGRSSALNAGFEIATGHVLIRCDDDLEPPPGWAREHVVAHEAAQPVGVIGLCRNVYPDSPYARAYGRKADALFRRGAHAAAADRTWRYWGGNVSVTRNIYDEVGPYSTQYRTYGWEDVDWGFRLHERGVPVRIVAEAEVPHYGASTSAAVRSHRAYLSGAARRTFERLHGPDAAGRVARPQGVWGGAVRGLARIESERRLVRISGFVDSILPLAPRAIGEKLVALTVESAAIAGYGRADERRSIL